jgi:hypothetical protein
MRGELVEQTVQLPALGFRQTGEHRLLPCPKGWDVAMVEIPAPIADEEELSATVAGVAKKQQMQWSRRGAHLLLQTRTRTLDGSLRAAFEHWYPGMMNDNDRSHRQAAA